MRIGKRIFTLVTTLLLSLAFCGHAQSEEYEAVSPSELSFGLTGFRAEAKSKGGEAKTEEGEAETGGGEAETGEGEAKTEEGGVLILNGTFEKFICEDKEIEVVEKKIKDGILETKDYGKVRVSIDSSGGLTVYVMPSQKKKFIEKVRK
jgi:hypothetical protein